MTDELEQKTHWVTRDVPGRGPFTARYATREGFRKKEWVKGGLYADLQAARARCAFLKVFDPDVLLTVVEDDEGEGVYFAKNRRQTIYDLAIWSGHPNPEQVSYDAIRNEGDLQGDKGEVMTEYANTRDLPGRGPFTAQYMTRESRRRQEWLDASTFADLQAARAVCAFNRAFDPDIWHTQVLAADGEKVYFVDNRWAAIYDMAVWCGHPDPEQVVNDAVGEE